MSNETIRPPTTRLLQRFARLVVAALLLTGAVVLPRPVPTSAAGPADVAAAQAHLAATRGGTAADWQLVYEQTAAIPRSNETMWAGKFVNGQTGDVGLVARDRDGRTGGEEMIRGRAAEVLASLEAFDAKASKELRDAVANGPRDRTLPVAVWLDADTVPAVAAVVAAHPEVTWEGVRPVANDLATIRALRAEMYEARRQVYVAAQESFAREVRANGGSVAYASTSAPLVFLDMPAGRVAALARRADVHTLGIEGGWRTTMASAAPTVEANWTGGAGDQGNGVRVAVVEYHNVRNSGDLSGQVVSSYSTSGSLAYSPAGTLDHPSWVAGAIASRNGTNPGVAPGADIVSGSTGGNRPSLEQDRNIVRATDWTIAPGGGDADVVNTSIVQDTAQGAEETRRYFDSIVWEDGRLAVSASGNYSALGTWTVGSPGTGYNVLTVGGTDDRGTAAWGDDRLWYQPGSDGASYVDPSGTSWNTHGDFNKPNVSAPAANVTTANGMAASGTSVATPIVSGIAAQLIANRPTLAAWPEAVRAIVMASAVHRTPMPGGGLSADHEGVGTVSARWAERIRNSGDGIYGGNRFGTMGSGAGIVQEMYVQAGQRVRVALAWDSHTGGSNNLAKSDTLMADLDLQVVQPNGSSLGSYTFDNSYEFVEFTAAATGTATIRIQQARFNASSEVYALAWTKSGGDQTRPTVTSHAPASNATRVSTTTTVRATFSEPVRGVTSATFGLRDTTTWTLVRATVTYDSATRTATLRPAAPLALGHEHRAVLTGDIKDAGGNALPWTAWYFTTVTDTTPPTVTSRSPAANATGVSPSTTVRATFSEPVSGVTSASFGLRDTTTWTLVRATVTYDAATRTATLRPAAPLALGHQHRVVLTGDIRDAAENRLAWTSWYFTTTSDVTPPTVTATSPASGASGVASDTEVRATFSEPVTGVTTASFGLRDTTTWTLVPATVTYDAATRTATLRPSAPLAAGHEHRAVLTSAIKDGAGNSLAWTAWYFTTAP